jgi:hypothetical protein
MYLDGQRGEFLTVLGRAVRLQSRYSRSSPDLVPESVAAMRLDGVDIAKIPGRQNMAAVFSTRPVPHIGEGKRQYGFACGVTG